MEQLVDLKQFRQKKKLTQAAAAEAVKLVLLLLQGGSGRLVRGGSRGLGIPPTLPGHEKITRSTTSAVVGSYHHEHRFNNN